MNPKNNRVELLAPAGDFEKFEIAIHYGADAVYLSGKDFSLRNFSDNFSLDEMERAIMMARENNVKVYVACNSYSRNSELKTIDEYLKQLGNIGPDAIIVADPGIISAARLAAPQIPLHLSTQANTTNYKAVLFWENQGVKRINLARELSLKEIKEIASQCTVEIETFVHGAMCISYSGRCLLSAFLSKRDSNRGMCSHPCRWKYSVVEELRPGEYMPLLEDNRGAYIFNSKDLCMIEHIPELIASGIDSLKIEGRMKGINYLASSVKVYREAIDEYYRHPEVYEVKQEWLNELACITSRDYSKGFYFGNPDQVSPNYTKTISQTGHRFVGKVIRSTGLNRVKVEVRNKIFKGDIVEVFGRKNPSRRDKINDIVDPDGRSLDFAQPNSMVDLEFDNSYLPNDLIRSVNSDFSSPQSGI